jgi:UDP-N-acetylmuramyl pentapeptide phosphotransferase/UDP-N-acetylglucosamine-1-phosphate transferase
MIDTAIAKIGAEIFLLIAVTAIFSTSLIALLRPLLRYYALVRPNVRSSHRQPTPQGAGIAVIGAAIIGVLGTFLLSPSLLDSPVHLAGLFFSVIVLAIVGATDDVRPLGIPPRFLLQAVAAIVVVATLPTDLRILPILPWPIERALAAVAIVWFVNLVNFMDGIDWMTIVEVVPVTGGLIVLGLLGSIPAPCLVISAALFGATIGFAPFNRPIAKLFLGDVGSLPIGLILAWQLISLAGAGHLVAALVLPMYYLADATVTLLWRLLDRQPVTRAHRSHYYQRAVDGRFSVLEVVSCVFSANIVLAILALLTAVFIQFWIQIAALLAAVTLVSWLLFVFSKSNPNDGR